MLRFDLSTCSHLRIFELRLECLSYAFRDPVSWLASIIGTITSPVFSRFVLEANSAKVHQIFRRIDGENVWELVDQALLRLSQQTGAKMIARGRVLHGPFCNVMEAAFPLMVSAGAFEFEPNNSSPCAHI